ACVERGRRDERDAARLAGLDHGADVFGAGAGLAEAAPSQQQPDAPIAFRGFLRVERFPRVYLLDDACQEAARQPRDYPLQPRYRLLLQRPRLRGDQALGEEILAPLR